jgi:myo-inositol-1(or 4)-monophosphatase
MAGPGAVPVEALEAAMVATGAFVREAASRIRPVTDKPLDPDNPTTDVDRETDARLSEALLAAFPPGERPVYLSEERPDDRSRLQARRVLIVDPIDGTRNLVQGRLEATISVALWQDGEVAWGCVHQPFKGQVFAALRGHGVRLDGRPARARQTATLAEALLYVSRHEQRKGWLAPLDGHVRTQAVGSVAYKMACVAAGLCDGTLTIHPRSEWDVAAGALLVAEAGGAVTDARGRPYAFNRPDVLVDGLVACAAPLHEAMLGLATRLRSGEGSPGGYDR